jgi:hypothetical protein
MTMLFQHPDIREIVEAVREWLEQSYPVQDRPYDVRVAVNSLRIVEREIELSKDLEPREQARLESLGYTDVSAFALAIRNGNEDGRYRDVKAFCAASVLDRLKVNNPRYPDGVHIPESAE